MFKQARKTSNVPEATGNAADDPSPSLLPPEEVPRAAPLAPDPDELARCLAEWEAAGELPAIMEMAAGSETPGSNPSGLPLPQTAAEREFAQAVREAWLAAEKTPVRSVPADLLTAYLLFEATPEALTEGTTPEMGEWLARQTGWTLKALADGLSERFRMLRRPVAAFTSTEADETYLPDTPVGGDQSIVASVVKRDGQILLRLQSQNAVLKNRILAVLLPHSPATDAAPGLVFVAMAPTGVGNWSVGWSRITEAERDCLIPEGRIDLRPVSLANDDNSLFLLLSLASAEEANVGVDPLAQSVWSEWMARWSRNLNETPSE